MGGRFHWNTQTGLYYNYFRTYDPETGRYLTADPIGLQGSLNTYLYSNANPISFIDPNGLSATLTWGEISAGGGEAAGSRGLGVLGPIGVIIGGMWPAEMGDATIGPDDEPLPEFCEKPAITDVEPNDLCEQLALQEAKAGAGVMIMSGLADEPRLIAHYGPGPWIKKQHTHVCPDGRKLVIHYFHSLSSGKNVELKFKN